MVDEDTVFATLIMQAGALPGVAPFPQEIMRWTEGFYRPAFEAHGEFRLRENGGSTHAHTHTHARTHL